jgi:hypothetical protein
LSDEKSSSQKDDPTAQPKEESGNSMSKNKKESDDVLFSDANKLVYGLNRSQIEYDYNDGFSEENLSDKPFTYQPQEGDKITEESHHFVNLTVQKLEPNSGIDSKDPFYLEVVNNEEEINQIYDTLYSKIDEFREKRSNFYSSNLEYTRDGYLMGKL